MRTNTTDVALMSINPQYVRAIMEGQKLVEFRKKKFSKNIHYVLVYETAPRKSVVGYFTVNKIDIGTPQDLWERHASIGKISKDDYFAYYKNSDIAIGILFTRFIAFKKYLNIQKFNIKPPQSFQYVNETLFENILKEYV